MSLFSYEQIQEMNPGEFRVYNYVVSHLDDAPKMKIRQLAEEAGVSTTTVLRFCEKAGCGGYTEFKYRIRQELGRQNRTGRYDVIPAVQYIENSVKDQIFAGKLEQAAKICADADQIVLSGDREKGTLNRYGAYLFDSVGKAAFVAENGYGRVCPGGQMKSAVLILSTWGNSESMVSMLNGYKQAGATLISLTNMEQCPAARMSDINFSCYMPEIWGISKAGSPGIVSQIPTVYLLETLAAEIQKYLK
ncbi:MAG: MurR/RpiR family transcriptional regulator [Dorea sp.]|nr:MurR/RpiR family transcriptional regulator [Dorea sp.]